MITYVASDLFQSPAQVLVNTVNTVGVMGKGIALEFKKIYPEMFKQYQIFCEKGQFDIGQLWLYKTPHKWILNFPTKKNWRQKSNPEYIKLGLQKFAETYDKRGITSISFPMLGCGNGELDWETEVQPIMEEYLRNLPIDIYIHLYHKKDIFEPEHRNAMQIEQWLHGEPQTLAFSEFWSDLVALIENKAKIQLLNQKETFHVKADSNNREIIIELKNGQMINIGESTLQDFWQYIRSFGFCLPQNFPDGLDKFSLVIVSMLSELSYIRPVLLSRNSNIKNDQIGLQLFLPIDKTTTSISEPLQTMKLA